MLLPIVFVVAVLAALCGGLLELNVRAASAAGSAAVARFADVAVADGVADVTHGLATYVARRGPGGPWPQAPSTSATKSLCPASGEATPACPFTYTTQAVITAASSSGGDSVAAGDVAANLQGSAIDEQRVSVVVTVGLLRPDGTPIGSRTRLLTYRVFAVAPYAVVAGSRDITSAGATSEAAGDDGGATNGGTDTRIHTRLRCVTGIADVVPFVNDQNVAGNDGLPWGDAPQSAYETPCATADEPVDAFHDERWRNGGGTTPGWTP